MIEGWRWERLGQNISDHILGRHVAELDFSIVDALSDESLFTNKMLGTSKRCALHGHDNGALVILKDSNRTNIFES